MADAPTAGTITVDEAARLLMLDSPRWIQKLAQEGYIEKAERGRYLTVSVVQGYIRYLKEERKEKSVSASESRVRDARAREIEIRTAKSNHELAEMTEVEAVVDEIAGMLRSEFIGLGAQVTRDIPMRRKIEAAVDDIFARTAARVAEEITALKSTGEAMDTDAEDDA